MGAAPPCSPACHRARPIARCEAALGTRYGNAQAQLPEHRLLTRTRSAHTHTHAPPVTSLSGSAQARHTSRQWGTRVGCVRVRFTPRPPRRGYKGAHCRMSLRHNAIHNPTADMRSATLRQPPPPHGVRCPPAIKVQKTERKTYRIHGRRG